MSNNQIFAIVQLHLSCNEVKNDSIIGPLFGQYGIKGVDFCNKFNEFTLSNNLITGLILKVQVIIYKNRTFKFFLKTSPLFFLFFLCSLNNILSIRDIFKILLIKRQDVFFLPLRIMCKSVLYTLKTFNYLIV